MRLEISAAGHAWLKSCHKRGYFRRDIYETPEVANDSFNRVVVFSFVTHYRRLQVELPKLEAFVFDIETRGHERIEELIFLPLLFTKRRATSLAKTLLNAAKAEIAFVENPLNKFRFHTCLLGDTLVKWLEVYNHLVEGQRLGQLTSAQIASTERTSAILNRVLEYFERCAALHNWHISHEKFKGLVPDAPVVGLRLEELHEIATTLTSIASEDAVEQAVTLSEQETALVRLQQELGALPALLGAS